MGKNVFVGENCVRDSKEKNLKEKIVCIKWKCDHKFVDEVLPHQKQACVYECVWKTKLLLRFSPLMNG